MVKGTREKGVPVNKLTREKENDNSFSRPRLAPTWRLGLLHKSDLNRRNRRPKGIQEQDK